MTEVPSASDSAGSAAILPAIPRKAAGTAALVCIVLLGAGLRTWQYASDTSLWLDEVALATGILTTDLSSLLTSPLPYYQVAPKGFLLLQKLATLALGPGDHALRLVPFLCSLIALAAFTRLGTKMLKGVAPLAAALLFATAAPFVAFGSLVKPYSMDVCVAVLLWWLAYELTTHPLTEPRTFFAALLGAILIWFSQPGVLMIVAFGALLLAWPLVSSSPSMPWRNRVTISSAWGLSALAATLVGFASMTAATRAYMYRYWADGFPPVPLSQVLNVYWPWDRLIALLGNGPGQACLAYPLPALYAILGAVGLGILWHENRTTCLLLAGPLAVTLVAAMTRQYPFSDQLILFLVPGVILAIAAAIEALRRLVSPFSRTLAAATVVGLIVPTVYPVADTPPAYFNEHMKAVLSRVRPERQPGDGIYVYYAAAPAVIFYGSQFGLQRSEYLVGGCHRGDNRRYLQELDSFRGHSRVWVLLTHSLPLYREREDILAYMDTIGMRKSSVTVESRAVGRTPLPAEAYLYDLSDGRKGASASADTFPLSGPVGTDPRLGCAKGPHAMVRADLQGP